MSYDDHKEEDEENIPIVTTYDDLWSIDQGKEEKPKGKRKKLFPPKPEKDLLLFIEQYSRELEEWQRDILTMMREEMLYFWPQFRNRRTSFWYAE